MENTYGIVPAAEMDKKILPLASPQFTAVREARGKWSVWEYGRHTYIDGKDGCLRCISREEAIYWADKLNESGG